MTATGKTCWVSKNRFEPFFFSKVLTCTINIIIGKNLPDGPYERVAIATEAAVAEKTQHATTSNRKNKKRRIRVIENS